MVDAIADEELEAAVAAFVRAARLLDGPRLHVWDERGLTLPQLRILFRIREQPGIGVRELARDFRVSASNVTQQVDKLVVRGLVSRTDRPEDRRQVALRLTGEGEAVAVEISHEARSHIRDLLGRLTSTERAQLSAALTRLMEAATEADAAPAHL